MMDKGACMRRAILYGTLHLAVLDTHSETAMGGVDTGVYRLDGGPGFSTSYPTAHHILSLVEGDYLLEMETVLHHRQVGEGR